MTLQKKHTGSMDPTGEQTSIEAIEAALAGLNVDSTGAFIAGGSTTGLFAGEGNLSSQLSVAGIGNGADTTDDVLFTYTLPAGALDVQGRAITITAYGKLGATANNKNVKLWFGATVVATTGVVATNTGGWQLQADVAKVGAAGSNTQIAQGQNIVAATHGGVNIPPAPTEVESGPIVIKVTGASSTTGAANDVLGQFFQVNWQN
jgi:hypothetical protein